MQPPSPASAVDRRDWTRIWCRCLIGLSVVFCVVALVGQALDLNEGPSDGIGALSSVLLIMVVAGQLIAAAAFVTGLAHLGTGGSPRHVMRWWAAASLCVLVVVVFLNFTNGL